MGWRDVICEAYVRCGALAAFAYASPALAADSSIPYRTDEAGLGLQAGLAYGSVVIVLGLAVAGLFMLRKRLAARVPGVLAPGPGLHSIASLRLPQQTLVHVVAYRDREILFAQSGDRLLRLGQFARSVNSVNSVNSVGSTDRSA